MDEMRVKVGVKESFHVAKMGDEKWQRDQMPRKCRGNGIFNPFYPH